VPADAQLPARRPFKVVAVALANKMARTAWALMVHGGSSTSPAGDSAEWGAPAAARSQIMGQVGIMLL